jgi:DNA invertase Pin-like site-specific DNA recombinase
MSKVAYGYARASTGGQSLTFDVQANAIERYFKERLEPQGYSWGGILEDKATSGTKPFTDRPNGLKLWTNCQRGDAVIFLKMDRAFRSVADGSKVIQQFREKGIGIHSLDVGLDTSSPLGEFVAHLLILLAQLERSWISNRTKEAMEAKRARGEGTTGKECPAGWKRSPLRVGKEGRARKDDDWFIPDPKERALLDECWEKWLSCGNNETVSAGLYWRKLERDIGGGYRPQFLLYAYFARARGYPVAFTFTRWKEMQQRMIAAGDWDASRDGLIGLMKSTQEQAPTA